VSRILLLSEIWQNLKMLESSKHRIVTLGGRVELVGILGSDYLAPARKGLASREGLEPPTHVLEGHCSIQMSYRDAKELDYIRFQDA
jgi:hypothetical protein